MMKDYEEKGSPSRPLQYSSPKLTIRTLIRWRPGANIGGVNSLAFWTSGFLEGNMKKIITVATLAFALFGVVNGTVRIMTIHPQLALADDHNGAAAVAANSE